jgi:hypothetical protein
MRQRGIISCAVWLGFDFGGNACRLHRQSRLTRIKLQELCA